MDFGEVERARVVGIISWQTALIADLVKNSLGPCGLEKVYIDIMGEITVTKDGSAILRKLDVEHPAAKILIEADQFSRQ